MEKFYCTFGYGHLHQGWCQVIQAPSLEIARQMMTKKYGNKWGFIYTEEVWLKDLNSVNRNWSMEEELPDILVYGIND
jgi:hypothetical protein